MADNLKDIYSNNKPAGGNGLFLKIEDGETIRLRFLDLPAVFDSEYQGKVSTKYAWPVYNHDEGKVQVYQGGATIYNPLNDLIQDSDWGDPSAYDIKITRNGKGQKTKYSVAPSPKSLELPKDLDNLDVVGIIAKSPYAENVHLLGEMFTPVEKDVVLEDIEDKPIDLSTIPF